MFPHLATLFALGAGLWSAPLWANDVRPARVVSMNVCTDQLAMLLADPGQLVSVSHIALDPRSSAMAEQARAYVINRGGAEQIYLMHPDLVLAGTYTDRAAVALLRQLGVRVVELPIAETLSDVPAGIRAMGEAMGQHTRAEDMARAFERDLAQMARPGPKARAALYYPNGYTAGAGTLSDQVLSLTGFDNIGAEAGLTGGGTLPLETLVMAAPDLLVTSAPYPGASRAEEVLTHPALSALRARSAKAALSDADWVCGTPY
ncbi:MAG: ABC transporter substrate-binding protein, partial [Rhodobacteraceae bacterium]|nr:ABC transporter substrate-binding protein [Paracoccaceae bacterium]